MLAQHKTNIIAYLDTGSDVLSIEQVINIHNDSQDTWDEIVLMDWANAYSSQETPLANRFAEDFKNRFQFAGEKDRGKTVIKSPPADAPFTLLRPLQQPDVLILKLKKPLPAGETIKVTLTYTVKLPSDNFTGYGKTSIGEYNLDFWYLHPAYYGVTGWEYYSHKDLHDFYGSRMDFSISLHIPTSLHATSNIPLTYKVPTDKYNSYLFEGNNYTQANLFIRNKPVDFQTYKTKELSVITDLKENDLAPEMKMVVLHKITSFLTEQLGPYPHDQIVISELYYKENPIYGLSSLPDFINPFPDGFTYEVRMLKAMTRKWIQEGLVTHMRDDFWISQAVAVYTMIHYQERYYPDLKISGKLSQVWGIRNFTAAQLDFNDRYALLFLNAARLNLDQSITTPGDSLVKYNQELGIPFKAGIGLVYLENYLGDTSLQTTIQSLFKQHGKQRLDVDNFQRALKSNTTQDISWFFDDYIASHVRMDWKIRSIDKKTDSITIKLKNKSGRMLPVPVQMLYNDSITRTVWLPPFVRDTVITLSRKRANRVAINYEQVIPEFSQRDNYRTLKNLPSLSRPISVRLFKDVENPEKAEVFLMPDIGYNLYDGVSLGARFYNGNLLPKPFRYSIKPAYGLTSGKLIGSIGFAYTHPLQDRSERLFQVRYGASANTFSYDDDLLYRRVSAFMNLSFRPEDLRSNKRQTLSIRNVLVNRDRDEKNHLNEPDYNVFSINWRHSDPNFKRFFSYNIGAEISDKFGKLDFTAEWRKLFKDNRQLNLRLYAGSFMYNDTGNDDFFSYALDRPTDYLFDYNYYGRSENSGLFSQQLIIAEGGFKSQLEPAFANQWIGTLNASYSIWKYIFAYGDIGLVKNQGINPQFVYDSGIRVNLLQDYFELYFPVYSNNGWEIAQQNYDQRIRFVVTLDINTFVSLFSRRWY